MGKSTWKGERMRTVVGVYEHRALQLMRNIYQASPNSLVAFTSLVPRPMDHSRSMKMCQNFGRSLETTVQDMRANRSWNCNYINIYDEFLDNEGGIKDIKDVFVEELYLLPMGICQLRAKWLRHFGFFLPRADKV